MQSKTFLLATVLGAASAGAQAHPGHVVDGLIAGPLHTYFGLHLTAASFNPEAVAPLAAVIIGLTVGLVFGRGRALARVAGIAAAAMGAGVLFAT